MRWVASAKNAVAARIEAVGVGQINHDTYTYSLYATLLSLYINLHNGTHFETGTNCIAYTERHIACTLTHTSSIFLAFSEWIVIGFHVAMRQRRKCTREEKNNDRKRGRAHEVEVNDWNPTKLLPSKWVFVCH